MNDIVASLIFGGGGGGGSKGYPEYVATEKNAVKARINALLEDIENPIVIGFITDGHISANPSSESAILTRDGVAYAHRALRDLTKEITFDLVVEGGDTHGGGSTTIEKIQASATYIVEQMKGTNCPYICLTGNHEGGQDNQNITRAQVAASHVTPSLVNNEIVPMDGLNAYMDDSVKQIRYIFIDTFARGNVDYTTAGNIRPMLTTLLSGMPAGYKAIIFSHHPMDGNLPYKSDHTGWNNPTDCHAVLQSYKDKILFCADGHVHNNLNADVDGVTFIATTCAGKYELNDGSTRTAGTATETAFDVYVVDTDNKVVHTVRYGNGDDREISYAHETPVEPRGNILADIGWTDGKRINSSMQLVDQSGYSVSDVIEDINDGDTLYFADGTLPMGLNAWTLYKDDGTSGGEQPGISVADYGADYNYGYMYLALCNSGGTMYVAYYWRGINDYKTGSNSNKYIVGEMETYPSGYVKSCKVTYDGTHHQGVHGIRVCFPTAKKADLDIRVNEPFEEE